MDTDPMNVYCGGACLERPRIRMSQIAASVESLGINLIHSLRFLKAGSSEENKNKDYRTISRPEVAVGLKAQIRTNKLIH